jgi:hypothetical protein
MSGIRTGTLSYHEKFSRGTWTNIIDDILIIDRMFDFNH